MQSLYKDHVNTERRRQGDEGIRTKPLNALVRTLAIFPAMPLVNFCEHLSHTQNLFSVNSDIGRLSRCATGWLCGIYKSLEREKIRWHVRWIIMLALGRQCRLPSSPRKRVNCSRLIG